MQMEVRLFFAVRSVRQALTEGFFMPSVGPQVVGHHGEAMRPW